MKNYILIFLVFILSGCVSQSSFDEVENRILELESEVIDLRIQVLEVEATTEDLKSQFSELKELKDKVLSIGNDVNDLKEIENSFSSIKRMNENLVEYSSENYDEIKEIKGELILTLGYLADVLMNMTWGDSFGGFDYSLELHRDIVDLQLEVQNEWNSLN